MGENYPSCFSRQPSKIPEAAQTDDGRVLQGPGWSTGPRLLALPFSRPWHAWEVPTYRVLSVFSMQEGCE